MKKTKKVVGIASTGGHLNELLQLKKLYNKYEVYLITEKYGVALPDKTNNIKQILYLPYGTRKKVIKYIFVFIIMCFKSLYYYMKIRPEIIITTGAHTAVPMCYIGKIFGAKIIYIETFANSKTKTLTGRLLYPIADLFIVQWKEMIKLYPKAKFGGAIY